MTYIHTTLLTQHNEAELRAAQAGVGLGSVFVVPDGYALIASVLPPAHNPVTQRVQEAPPMQTSKGRYEQQWLVSTRFKTQVEDEAAIAADVQAKRLAAVLKIDVDTDALYGAVLGNRTEEYTSAANDAAAYKAAGYTGKVPPGVQSWASAKNWPAKKAADDILVTAAAWVNAQNAIRATRLFRKEQVRTATNTKGVADALTAWLGFLMYIRKMLGVTA